MPFKFVLLLDWLLEISVAFVFKYLAEMTHVISNGIRAKVDAKRLVRNLESRQFHFVGG